MSHQRIITPEMKGWHSSWGGNLPIITGGPVISSLTSDEINRYSDYYRDSFGIFQPNEFQQNRRINLLIAALGDAGYTGCYPSLWWQNYYTDKLGPRSHKIMDQHLDRCNDCFRLLRFVFNYFPRKKSRHSVWDSQDAGPSLLVSRHDAFFDNWVDPYPFKVLTPD